MKWIPFGALLLVFLAALFYVGFRIGRLVPQPLLRVVLLAAYTLAALAFFGNFLLRGQLPEGLAALMYKVGTSWLILLLYLLLSFLLLDALRLIPGLQAGKWLSNNWWTFGLLAGGMSLLLIGGNLNYHHKKRTELTLEIDKPGGPLKQLNIVALSDLHLGYGIGRAELESWLPLIEREHPDLILLAGDLVDGEPRPLFDEDFAASLRKLKAPLGVYAVLGNHEYICGLENSLRFLRETGITLLRDSAVLVDGSFYLIGRDDRSNRRRKPLAELLAPLDTCKPLLLLDHQPARLEDAVANHIDLQISGHTHQGQVWPISLLTSALFEDDYGYLKKGRTQFYVTSGMGIWGGKFRIGTRSEYLVLHLKFK
ncbi:MAG: metallophosphoesterase [Tannerella sp.]|jgi:predicted MPP superfamily phosphohydrolase|nr:metallophosphoesterase [Tannerella sp.]